MALAVLLTLVPLSAQQAPKVSAPYEMFTLPNGLTVILHEDHSVPMAVSYTHLTLPTSDLV